MDAEGWAWVFKHGDDSEFWQEEAEIQAWIEAGAPPAGEWEAEKRGEQPKPLPSSPGHVEVPERALAVSREVAANLLQVSLDSFLRHVLPQLRVLQIGKRQMIPVVELEDYVNRNAARALRSD